ncbi:uncharacterized protein [Oscarella lobularis]|uniref:uncharacterized protein n=1 Tax=Oscarella lobularis TaxID=121494 RepID=UPI0033132498
MLFPSLLCLWCLLSTTSRAALQQQEDVPCSHCSWLNTTREVYCASKKLTRLPPASCYPDSAISFNFDYNEIQIVDSTYFLYFSSSLTTINGTHNKLTEPFLLPRKLAILYLNYNKLRSTIGFFQNGTLYSSLTNICLSDNQLRILPQRVFANLPSLIYLYLDFNQIELIEPNAFTNLPKLQEITFKRNAIKNITKDSFSNVDKILTMNLISNQISHLPPNFLGLPSLSTLDLSNNTIRTVSPKAFNSLPRLQKLSLSSNYIQSFENNTFAFQTFPLFFLLDLSHNQLTFMNGFIFQRGTALMQLFLQHNKLKILSDSLMENILVQSLYVSGNNLKELPTSLSKQSHLQILDCMFNSISSIRGESFQGLTHLRKLNLMHNNITSFDKEAFANLRSIENLYLQGNPFEHMPRLVFNWFPHNATVYMRCSGTFEMPQFPPDTHLQCTTKAAGIEMNFDQIMRPFVQQMGYTCKEKEVDFFNARPIICSQCPVGTESRQGQCTACPAGGFYQDTTGKRNCSKCVDGTYVSPEKQPGTSATDCAVCPEGTNTTRHAGHRACYCLKNFYRLDRFGRCYACLEKGQNCTNDYLHVKTGYWMSWNVSRNQSGEELENKYYEFITNIQMNTSYNESTMKFSQSVPKIHPCPIPGSCNGVGPVQLRFRESSMCTKGYEGTLCAVCQPSYYSWFQKCYECSAKWRTGLQILGVAVVLFIVLLILYIADRNRERSHNVVDRIASKVKILVGFGQVMAGVFEALAYVPWPKVLLLFGHYLKLIELNAVAVAKPSCLAESLKLNALKSPLVMIGFQIGLILTIWTYYFIRYTVISKCTRFGTATNRTLSLARISCLRNTWWILFVCYPATTAQVVTLLPYKPWTCFRLCLSSDENSDSCKWLLKSDLSLECNYESKWKALWIICWTLYSYVLALPILLFIGLLYRRKKQVAARNSNDEEDLNHVLIRCYVKPVPFKINLVKSLYFLHESYKKKFWFWEITEILRKFVLTCGIQFLGEKSHSGIAIAALLANIFLLLHAQLRPLKRKGDHWLQLMSLAVISLNLTVGTLMAMSYDEETYDNSKDQSIFSIIVLVINGLFVLYVLGKLVYSVILAVRHVKKKERKVSLIPLLVQLFDGPA